VYGIEPINSTALDFCGYSEQCHSKSSAIKPSLCLFLGHAHRPTLLDKHQVAAFSFALNLNHLDPLNSTFPEENCNMIEIKLRNYPWCTMYSSVKNGKQKFDLSFLLSATTYNAMKLIRSIPSKLVQCNEAHKMEHRRKLYFADTLSKRIFAVPLPVANLQAHNSGNSGSLVLQICNQQTWKAATCHTTHRRGISQQRNNIQSSFQLLLVKSNAQVINGLILQLCATTLLEKRFTL